MEAAKTALPKLNVEMLPPAVGAPAIKQPMDLSASKKHLGWEPRFSLEAGFAEYAGELGPWLESRGR